MNTKLHSKGGTWTCLIIIFVGLPSFGEEPLKLGIQSIPASNSLSLSWQSETGKTYRVLSQNKIGDGWSPSGDRLTASSDSSTVYVFPGKDSEMFRIEEMGDAGGLISLVNGQFLTGTISVKASAYSLVNRVQSVQLLDISGGQTNILDAFLDTSATDGIFQVDTSSIPNGDHALQLKVIDDNGTPFSDDMHISYTDPVSVTVSNEIYVAADSRQVGWMLSFVFNTTIRDGYWYANLYKEDDTFWHQQGGRYLDDPYTRDRDGNIAVHDWGDPRGGPRDFSSGYTQEFFTVQLIIVPAAPAGTPVKPKVKTYRARVQRRFVKPLSIVCEHNGLIRGQTRLNADFAFETILQSLFSFTGQTFEVTPFRPTTTPTDTEGWNKLFGPDDWKSLNRALGGTNGVAISHMFYIGHAGPEHLGYTNADQQVSADTLEANGFYAWTNVVVKYPNGMSFTTRVVVKRAALAYLFADGCNTMDGSIVSTLISAGYHQYFLGQLINKGLYPGYGCGWSGKKFAALTMSDLESFHADFIQYYHSVLATPDPEFGWLANTYKETYARARYQMNDPSSLNPAAKDLQWVGCEELYSDE